MPPARAGEFLQDQLSNFDVIFIFFFTFFFEKAFISFFLYIKKNDTKKSNFLHG